MGLGHGEFLGFHSFSGGAKPLDHPGDAAGIPGDLKEHAGAGAVLEASGELDLAGLIAHRPAMAMLSLEGAAKRVDPGLECCRHGNRPAQGQGEEVIQVWRS